MFWETAHLPLPKPNINTNFSFWAKYKVRGGVGGQFPQNLHWSTLIEISVREKMLHRSNIYILFPQLHFSTEQTQ